MAVLRKLWWGEYSLPVAFWLFYCIGTVATIFLGGVILFLSRTINARPIAFIVCFALSYGYWLMASMGVWRSASPYWKSPIWMQRIWAAAARIVVAIGVARFVLGLIDGGAVAIVQRMMAGDADF
jgi:hypothetical protein